MRKGTLGKRLEVNEVNKQGEEILVSLRQLRRCKWPSLPAHHPPDSHGKTTPCALQD